MGAYRIATAKVTDDQMEELSKINFHDDVLKVDVGPLSFYHAYLRWFTHNGENYAGIVVKDGTNNPVDAGTIKQFQKILRDNLSNHRRKKKYKSEDELYETFNPKFNEKYPLVIHRHNGTVIDFPTTDYQLSSTRLSINEKKNNDEQEAGVVFLGNHRIQYIYMHDQQMLYHMTDVLDAFGFTDVSKRVEATRMMESIERTINYNYVRYIGIETILRFMGWTTSQVSGYQLQRYNSPLSDRNLEQRLIRANQYMMRTK